MRSRLLRVCVLAILCAAFGVGTACSAPCEDTLTCNVSDDDGAGGDEPIAGAIGSACTSQVQCNEGTCIDGYCCRSAACDGVCQSCAVPGAEGECSAVTPGATDPTCDGSCDGNGSCSTGAILSTQVVGATGDQYAIGHSVAADGSIPIGVGFDGSFNWGTSHPAPAMNSGTVVGRLAQDFQPLWASTLADPNSGASLLTFQGSASGSARASGLYTGTLSIQGQSITAPPGGTAYVAGFDASGALSWLRNLTTSGIAVVFTMAFAEDGSTYLGGLQLTDADYGDGTVPLVGTGEAFILKYDSVGTLTWKKTTASPGSEGVFAVAATQQNELVAVGNFDADVDFGGGVLSPQGTRDVFLVKYDAAGNHLWSRSVGQSDTVVIYDLATDAAGNIVAVGQFDGAIALDGVSLESSGGQDALVLSFDPLGNLLWARNYGNFNDQAGRKATFDVEGNIYFTGFYTGSIDFGQGPLQTEGGVDGFVTKVARDGTPLWTRTLAGPADDHRVDEVAIAPDGSVVVTGWTVGQASFGGVDLPAADGLDIFMARLSP